MRNAVKEESIMDAIHKKFWSGITKEEYDEKAVELKDFRDNCSYELTVTNNETGNKKSINIPLNSIDKNGLELYLVKTVRDLKSEAEEQ